MDKTSMQIQSGFVEKCFLLRENLIISILKMATGKEFDDLDIEDAQRMSLVITDSIKRTEDVLIDGNKVGTIYCEFPQDQLKVVYTFKPQQ